MCIIICAHGVLKCLYSMNPKGISKHGKTLVHPGKIKVRRPTSIALRDDFVMVPGQSMSHIAVVD